MRDCPTREQRYRRAASVGAKKRRDSSTLSHSPRVHCSSKDVAKQRPLTRKLPGVKRVNWATETTRACKRPAERGVPTPARIERLGSPAADFVGPTFGLVARRSAPRGAIASRARLARQRFPRQPAVLATRRRTDHAAAGRARQPRSSRRTCSRTWPRGGAASSASPRGRMPTRTERGFRCRRIGQARPSRVILGRSRRAPGEGHGPNRLQRVRDRRTSAG